ncbi:hypothetical protein Q75_00555 [Bacillus coahuilensis p1.1.43]|uniref:Lipoprotein n=1 Tax=Bacillus coahuilensis p1.1.43 TaxID=1150625 RepID=A0A147KCM9_9BACI|nr:hypothetical protein [Bacillus coahuilensis]KUP09447.1 hypothetical protein Q75_00555 [Bacillus coahuilensis p1.1.43]
MKNIVVLLGLVAVLLVSGCGFEEQVAENKEIKAKESHKVNNQKKEQEESVDLVTESNEVHADVGEDLTELEKVEAFLTFMERDIEKVSRYEVEAFDSHNSVTGEDYTDDFVMYDELVNHTIPTYEKAVAAAREIEVQSEELVTVKEQVVIATETFYEALLLEKQALEDQDEALIVEFQAKLEEYYQLIDAYHTDMELLAEKYNVNYEPDQPITDETETL